MMTLLFLFFSLSVAVIAAALRSRECEPDGANDSYRKHLFCRVQSIDGDTAEIICCSPHRYPRHIVCRVPSRELIEKEIYVNDCFVYRRHESEDGAYLEISPILTSRLHIAQLTTVRPFDDA